MFIQFGNCIRLANGIEPSGFHYRGVRLKQKRQGLRNSCRQQSLIFKVKFEFLFFISNHIYGLYQHLVFVTFMKQPEHFLNFVVNGNNMDFLYMFQFS